MDEDPRRHLFDPTTSHLLVLARRPARASAVAGVVSDVVWHDVVRLLRWATADTRGTADLDTGRWWRLAAACADVLRRLPGLLDELGEPWAGELVDPPRDDDDAVDGPARVERAADRLAALLVSPDPVPLRRLAAEVDALGAAALSALAERSSWTVPGAAS
jgi:hypothetical protein